MAKSFWLMSAGVFALASVPAQAQDNSNPTGQGTPVESGSVRLFSVIRIRSIPVVDDWVDTNLEIETGY